MDSVPEKMNCSIRTYEKYLKQLTELGLIKVIGEGFRMVGIKQASDLLGGFIAKSYKYFNVPNSNTIGDVVINLRYLAMRINISQQKYRVLKKESCYSRNCIKQSTPEQTFYNQDSRFAVRLSFARISDLINRSIPTALRLTQRLYNKKFIGKKIKTWELVEKNICYKKFEVLYSSFKGFFYHLETRSVYRNRANIYIPLV